MGKGDVRLPKILVLTCLRDERHLVRVNVEGQHALILPHRAEPALEGRHGRVVLGCQMQGGSRLLMIKKSNNTRMLVRKTCI